MKAATRCYRDGSAGVGGGEPPLGSGALAPFPTCVIARSTSIAALVPAPIHTASMVAESVYTIMLVAADVSGRQVGAAPPSRLAHERSWPVVLRPEYLASS